MDALTTNACTCYGPTNAHCRSVYCRIKAYMNGVASVREPKTVPIGFLHRAIKDYHEMGWSYLEWYFRGKLDMAQAARGIERAAKRMAEIRKVR